MTCSHKAPEGAQFLENWASQLLREKGHAIGAPEQWTDGLRRAVDDLPMTKEEIIGKARAYPEWEGRRRLFLEYLNGLQELLAPNT